MAFIGLDFLKTLSVLYVEDEDDVREALAHYLERRVGTLHTAANGREGAALFDRHRPDVVVTDIKMPVMDGLEMAAYIKSRAPDVPVILTTAYSEVDFLIHAIEIGVVQYLTKPVNLDELVEEIYKSGRTRAQQLEREHGRQIVVDTLEQTIAVLSREIERPDADATPREDDDGHQQRVSRLAAAIAREMGLPLDTLACIRVGSLVHNLGYARIPAQILGSARTLDKVEMDIVRTHPRIGHDLLARLATPWPLAAMVLQHHERLDGSGYPQGLKGDAIGIAARVVAVADVVEAMSAQRPYRAAPGLGAAILELLQNRGRLYDERAVDACIKVLENAT